MKKKIVYILLGLVTIINIVAAAFIFIDIQILAAPETTVNIDIIEINSNEMSVQTTLEIYNPNSFEIVTKDFEIVTTTPSGEKVIYTKIEGGGLPPNEKTTFSDTFLIEFKGNSPGLLNTRVSGIIGMKTGFMEKTIQKCPSVTEQRQ